MKKNIHTSFIYGIILILFISSNSINASSDTYNKTDLEKLSFKQELSVPIDTSLEEAVLQPIDIHIDFINPCWAISEIQHSVRVGFDDGSSITEIDSQIYDLEYSDESHIKSCNIVFLIPEKATGNEKYFIFYDSTEKEAANYVDHIFLEDTHYFYEPISGQRIDFDYYKIIQDEYIIYGVIQKGEIIGNPVSQHIAKVIPNSKIFETNTIDQLAAFDIRYGIFGEPDYSGPAAATKINKKILVDGNLMVRFKIEGVSPRGDTITDNIYTYYFSPIDTKRIFVDVNHEVLKTVDIEDPDVLDGIYSGIITIKSRSKTIEKMNVGTLLPSIHIYDEDETIKEYFVPPDPESVVKELILSTEDDIDLGSKGWICLDDPSTGKVHGLVIQSNKGLIDEEDGIQIKAYTKQNIKLPGIEGDTGSVFLGKNTYEKGGSHTSILPQGFKINFGIVFISDEDEGYEKIDSESELIQTLIKSIPIKRENVTDKKEEKEKHTLTTYIHFASSAPMGSLLSAALGKNIPYINAELYQETSLKSSGTAGRLPMGAIDLNLEGNIFKKIKTIIGLFDWKNASFFKKIKFSDLEPGTYIIKIFRENRLFGKDRQYIGFSIIDLKKDEKVRIHCRPQSSIKLSIFDTEKNGVGNVKCLLNYKDVPIYDSYTDENGFATLNFPTYVTKKFSLKVIYQGFLVKEKNVKINFINRLITKKESFTIIQYNLNVNIKDTWGFSPEVEVSPTISSAEMVEQVQIKAEKINLGEYKFISLYPANYFLNMKYKSFEINKDVQIDNDKTMDITFPAEFELNFDITNNYGYSLSKGDISLSRYDKSESEPIDKNGKIKILVPPGKYKINVHMDGNEISRQEIDVRGDKKINILTSEESFIHTFLVYFGIILVITFLILIFWKKKVYTGVKLLVVALLLISLFSPWWVLNGNEGEVTTTTKTLLVPPTIISFSSSPDVLGGDVSQLPSEATMVLSLLSIIILVSCLIILFTIFTKNKYKKITTILSLFSIIFLILTISIFFYAMSQITEVGVGSFIGSGDIDTSFPGIAKNKILPSNWGPGFGFYLCLLSFMILIIYSIYSKLIKKN
ncbi:hypothetical protein AYK24_03575 [Thermoplasmatales archaeon SG8-52-4]|nr:MAG: hypothetical protein AYK24_03575 [Thermoplasmatales archaeon SG8-52-4]